MTSSRTTLTSPVLLIERSVQDRAKTVALELDGPDGDRALRALIDDEVARWQDDHKRGLRPFALSTPPPSPNAPTATSPPTGRSPRSSMTTTSGRS